MKQVHSKKKIRAHQNSLVELDHKNMNYEMQGVQPFAVRTLSAASAVELMPKMEVGVNNSIDEKRLRL